MDWKTLHLAWIKRHEKFVPKGGYLFDSVPYYDVMSDMYQYQKACSQNCAKLFYESDLKWFELQEKQQNQIAKSVLQSDPEHLREIFVTIGFNHQTWDIPSCVKVIEKIVNASWVHSVRAVFELHRKNGEHPHCHFLIKQSDQLTRKDRTKSKVLERLWAIAGMKKVCREKSFIDYKIAETWHYDYIELKKTSDKMPYVDKDKQWRIENNIPEYWEK